MLANGRPWLRNMVRPSTCLMRIWSPARVQFVKASLAGLAQVYFAVKANPNLALLRAVHDAVDGVDISSGGEQRQAQRAGYAPERMSFAGPAKTDEELHAAINAGVGCISVESMREIEACASIARRLGKPAHILLRVNPMQVHKSYGLKMGGRAVQFGIDEDRLPEAERRVLELAPHLVCRGLHSYVGSQCFDTSGMLDATANALRMAAEHESRTGQPCLKLNLGGGLWRGAEWRAASELQLDECWPVNCSPLLRVFLGTPRLCRSSLNSGASSLPRPVST
jgi:diaminopimelate decarboxylase